MEENIQPGGRDPPAVADVGGWTIEVDTAILDPAHAPDPVGRLPGSEQAGQLRRQQLRSAWTKASAGAAWP